MPGTARLGYFYWSNSGSPHRVFHSSLAIIFFCTNSGRAVNLSDPQSSIFTSCDGFICSGTVMPFGSESIPLILAYILEESFLSATCMTWIWQGIPSRLSVSYPSASSWGVSERPSQVSKSFLKSDCSNSDSVYSLASTKGCSPFSSSNISSSVGNSHVTRILCFIFSSPLNEVVCVPMSTIL